MKLIAISPNTLHHQASGCWMCVQVGYTAFLFQGLAEHCRIRVYIAAPRHDTERKRYSRKRWGMQFGPKWW